MLMLKTNYATHNLQTKLDNLATTSEALIGDLRLLAHTHHCLLTSLHFKHQFLVPGLCCPQLPMLKMTLCWHWDKLVLDCSNLPGSCCLVSSSAGLLGVRCARQLCTLPLALSQLNCAVWTVQDCTQLYRTVSAASIKLYSTHNVIIL